MCIYKNNILMKQMKNIITTLIIIILCMPLYAQFGNITVIEPKDVAFSSVPVNEEGILHFKGPGYVGVFVEAQKSTRVKITVSAKGVTYKYNQPLLKFYCDGQMAGHTIRDHGFDDYSVNFSVEKGIHFLKVENTPFLRSNYPEREVFMERFYVSGNGASYVENVTEDVILSACKSYTDDYRKVDFTLNNQVRIVPIKQNFDWGIILEKVTFGKASDLIIAQNRFDFIVNEEDERYQNPIGDSYTPGDVTFEDPYAKDFCERLNALGESRAETEFTRLTFVPSNKEGDVKALFSVLHALNVYSEPVQVYNLYCEKKENLEKLVSVIAGVKDVRGVVLSEKSLDMIEERPSVFNVDYIGHVKGRYKYKLIPGLYKAGGYEINVESRKAQ